MIGFHPAIQIPERVSLTCALGLRFLDVATSAFVTADLTARAWPVGDPWQTIDGLTTPSGIIAFHGLPGLRGFENSRAEDPWDPEPAARTYQIEVTDTLGRYLPCRFVVHAPTKGLALFAESGSPPWIGSGAVPLFSAPARPVPGALAVVRAELRDPAARAAAWALVEAAYSSRGLPRIAYGLADDVGRVVLIFPYPEGQRQPLGGSPPGNGGLAQQSWILDLSFFYEPTSGSEGSPPNDSEPEQAADYALRLAQPEVFASLHDSPLTFLGRQTLSFGQELDLGTIDLTPA
jgi:hypothetical protein